MRRAYLALFSMLLSAPLVISTSTSADALAAPASVSLVQRTTSSVKVSWPWSKKARQYTVQAAKDKAFTKRVDTLKVRAASSRPAGGRQAARISGLADGMRLFVRVRAHSGSGTSGWSTPLRTSTKAHYPTKIVSARAVPGPGVGETTLSWRNDGSNLRYTDFYRITTATTPFSPYDPAVPDVGANSTVFKVSGKRTSITLTREQTQQAGAGVGTGFNLIWRISAWSKGTADSQERAFGPVQSAEVRGPGPVAGTAVRAATYNVRSKDAVGGGPSWADRVKHVAANIAAVNPAVVSLQEFEANSMWDDLRGALRDKGAAKYALTRADKAFGARLLYDTSRLELLDVQTARVSSTACSDGCTWTIGTGDRQSIASYARMRVKGTQAEFLAVSFHLDPGNKLFDERARREAARDLVAKVRSTNDDKLPIIAAGDTNSHQTFEPTDSRGTYLSLPHDAFRAAGFFDTASAQQTVNFDFNTTNKFVTKEQPNPRGFGARLDVVFTYGMPGAERAGQRITGAPYGSDHNLVYADVRVPAA